MFPRITLLALALLAVGLTVPAQGDPPADQFAVAAGHYSRARWELAVEEFDTFLQRFPDHGKADASRFFMAEALLQQGRADEAANHFAEYLRRAPGGRYAKTALFRVGGAAYLAGQLAEAKGHLTSFAEKHPDDPRTGHVLAYLGQIALARGDATTATGHFEKALGRLPEGRCPPSTQLGLAKALEQLGRRDEAARLYDALAGGPSSPVGAEARFRLGALQYAGGDYRRANDTLGLVADDSAAGRWPARGRLMRALALRKLGQLDEAAALLAGLVDDGEHGIEAQYWLAAVHKDRRRWADAAKLLLAAAEKAPNHRWIPAIHFHAGHALLRDGRVDEADARFDMVLDGKYVDNDWLDDALLGKIEVAIHRGDHANVGDRAQQLLDRFPDSPLAKDARRYWATSLLARGDDQSAARLLRQTLAEAPDEKSKPRLVAQLAVALARGGQWGSAEARLNSLLKTHAADEIATPTVEQVAEAAYVAGEWDRAATWFAWLVDHAPGSPAAHRALAGLGWTQFKQGHSAEAAETFGRLLGQKPDAELFVRAAWARGHVLERLDRLDEALTAYQKALDAAPPGTDTPKIMLAAARLHRRLEQPDRAAEFYERLAEQYPKHAERDAILYEWSLTLRDQGLSSEADRLLARLRREFPDSPLAADAAYRLAEDAVASGDRAKARRLLAEVHKGDASSSIRPHALALSCQIDAAEERWPEVHTAATDLLETDADGPLARTARFWIAESLYRQGDYEKAAARLDELLAQTGDGSETYLAMVPLRRAQIHARRQQWTDAYELVSTIERDYPGFDRQYEVDYLLGRCLAARAQFDAARRAYGRVVESDQGAKTETAAMAQWMIGETHFHQQDYAQAIRAYLRVEILYDYPRWQAAALLQAAKCQEQLKQPRQAQRLYRRLVDQYPVSPFVEQAKQRLASTAQRTTTE